MCEYYSQMASEVIVFPKACLALAKRESEREAYDRLASRYYYHDFCSD